jgi:PAS domain S-box-containing protein
MELTNGELKTVPADAVTPESIDCAEELINLPGSVQRHGFLLVLDESSEDVVSASENAAEFLGVPVKLILGSTLDQLVEREVLSAVRALLCSTSTGGLVTYLGAFRVKGELCSVVTHCQEGRRILEFEKLDRLVISEIMNAVITNFVGKLSRLESTLELCQAITKQVKDLTGFNRVLLYSFDEAGHGTVLTEESDGVLPSYLGLRFPASDIPQQARALYVLNTIRIIPDAQYEPSPLMGMPGMAAEKLDLSLSVLRSVAPVHLEYMRNMGTMSSMSISIVHEGKLWGLISGHHATPRTVPFLVRSACDMLTKMVGNQLSAFRTAEKLGKMVHFHAVQRRMLTQMAADKNYLTALKDRLHDLMLVTDASGAALLMEGQVERTGITPDQPELLRLAEWLDTQPEVELFESRHLSDEVEWASSIREVASGLLAIRVSDVRRSYILWFRPEVQRTVLWAGEPIKREDDSAHLHPRTSFESWREIVVGQSAPWSEMEIESAWDFRTALMTIGLQRAEREAELSEARFQQLTHALPDLVWTSDDNGTLTYVNERWMEVGIPRHGIWFEVASLKEEDKVRVAAAWSRAVSVGGHFEEEVRLRQTSGVERWHLIRAVPFVTGSGRRAGWVGTFTDTTDRRNREAALRMTEKLATTGRMTSVIAHEINNPLESITNLMYLLRGELRENATAQEYIATVESELERISGITKQTLRWTREAPERVELVGAGVIFDDVLRLFAGKIRNRQVTATVRGGRDVLVRSVSGQMNQVIANLVSNAVDAAPLGGNVWLSAAEQDGKAELAVEDNGAGMTPEALGQLFQPFYSTKGDLGNGLGLYISREIVERYGGRVEVESAPRRGTKVRITVPSVEDHASRN